MRLPVALLSLAFLIPAGAQVLPPGPQVLTFFSPIDDSDQPYALYLPKNFNAKKHYPLVMSLHGAFSNHRLNLRRVFGQGNREGENDAEATRYFPPLPDVDFIVASPLARGTMGYRGMAGRDVLAVLADVKRRFPIDDDRVYLTGLSMGGGGTLELGLAYPDLWAAIVPLCPVPPYFGESYIVNAHNLPVHFHHGDADKLVPADVSRRWSKLMQEAGINVAYKEYPGVAHNVWDHAYAEAAIFGWFAQHKRNRFPERVRFASITYDHNRAYWVRLNELVPGKTATIDARFTGPNRLEIQTENLPGFSLAPDGHPRYDKRKPLEVVLNGEARAIRPGEPLDFGGRAEPPPLVRDVTAARHVYVYGTGGNPTPQELRERRAMAARATEWIGGGSRVHYNPRVLPDNQVRESDLKQGNLILFGTPATNSVIARIAARAPLALRDGAAATHGLIYALRGEAPGSIIVVNSGLSFWTGGERTPRGGLGFLPLPHRILLSVDELLLFRESLANIVAEGFISEQRARLPAEVVELR